MALKEAKWELVQDDRGRIVGKYWSKRPLYEEQIQIVKNFLCGLNQYKHQEQREVTLSKNERCNMVWLAGVIKSIKIREDGSGFMLVDTESDQTKYIPCTIYENKELGRKLARFEVGDVIKTKGYVRTWSQKKDGGDWVNKSEVRITEINNEPPQRRESSRASSSSRADDDVPY